MPQTVRILFSAFVSISMACIVVFCAVQPAYAWKPNTHVYLAEEALKDAVDDCKISIFRTDYEQQQKLEPVGNYEIAPDLCNALRDNPKQYRAGLLGPDAYPDILTGQRIIHAEVSRPTGSNAWLDHIWTTQPDNNPKAQAFVLGYLTHAAGDMYAHTLVNNYTGGPFEPGPNAVRHVILEGYIGKRTPDITDRNGRSIDENSYSIDGVEGFIYESMINAQPNSVLADQLLIGNESATSVPAIYSTLRDDLVKDVAERGKCRRFWFFSDPVCSSIKAYENAWVDDIDAGLKAWPKVSHQVAKAIVFDTSGSDFAEAEAILSQYVNRHLLSMSGAPDAVGAVSEAIGNVVEAITPARFAEVIAQMKRDLLNYMLLNTFEITVEEMEDYTKSPQTNFDPVLGSTYEQAQTTTLRQFNQDVLKLTDAGYDQPNERFNYETVAAAYNTVTLSKLIMLSPDSLNQLLRDLGSTAQLSSPNVMIGFIRSLDSDNEWHRHSDAQMVLSQDDCAYTQIFMRQDGESWQPSEMTCAGR